MMKSKKTSRKFYNKWLYKISLKIEGASGLRMYSLEQLREIFNGSTAIWIPSFLENVPKNDQELLLSLMSYLETKSPDTWAKRIERKCLDIYSNDKDIFDYISKNFEEQTIHRFEPHEGSLEQLENAGTIVGKKLPHGKYRFRVYLLPHKLAHDDAAKEKYLSWVKTQFPKITCSTSVEEWFMKTNWNWDRRYVLVEDEQTLLMLKLRNADVVGRIYNYVIADK